MIAETLRWWLVIEGIGLIALPIAFVLFERLPDRGYAFAKPLGILLGGYIFWLALSAHLLPNRPGSVVWAFIAVAIVSGLIFRRRRTDILAALEGRAGLILAVEAVFALTLALAVYLRSYIPEIDGTEKPMDFMLLNAAARSRFYPPSDAWLAGEGVSYYYFGYVLQAMLSKLAAVPTAVGFNLGLASTAALAATAVFGLGYNLVSLVRNASFRAAILAGGAAVLLLVVIGNLEGVVEFAIANGVAPSGFVSWLGIANLETAARSSACFFTLPFNCLDYPNEQSSFWWWWRATRISPDANSITEFPFFSFLLGDLHPHVMALPYVLTTFALGLAFWRSESPLAYESWRLRPPLLLLSAVVLGGLGFLNTWDLPTLTFIATLLVLARNYVASATDGDNPALQQRLRRAMSRPGGFMLPLLVLAFLLYAPFYLSFSTQASGFEAVTGGATRPIHSALLWTPLLVVSLPLPLSVFMRDRAANTRLAWQLALLPAALLFLWTLFVLAKDGPAGLGDAITARGLNWLTVVFFATALVVCLTALVRVLGDASDEDSDAVVPVLVATSVAMLLIIGGELFFVRDVFSSRLNTVFKLSYQAWLLLAVSGAYGVYFLSRQAVAGESRAWHAPRILWSRAAAVVLIGALLYPIGATLSRTNGLSEPNRTLDGLAFARQRFADEYTAIEWLRLRADPGERIVEGTGGQYSSAARASAWTGVPAVVGWAGHEVQWGRSGSFVGARTTDVDIAYTTPSLADALAILQKYDVTYVYIGPVERAKYPPDGLQKFEALPVFFQSNGAAIYRIPLAAADELTRGAP